MKKKVLAIVAFIGVISGAVYAAYPAAQTARIKFSTTPILTSAYVQLIASTTRPVGEIDVWNSGSATLQIALGAAGSEQVQLTIPASTGSPNSQQVARYPLLIPAGQRVSVIALDASTGTVGDLEVNFLFN